MTARVLVVDDDPVMCNMVVTGLAKRGFQAEAVTAGAEAFERLRAEDYDVVVTDLNMRGMNGNELCARIVADRPDVPVIVITAFGRMESAIDALRAGAHDFLPKPFAIDHLVMSIERAVKHRRLREEVVRLRRAAAASEHYGELLGDSVPMRDVRALIDRVRDSEAPVLITGASGTGKELVARALHERGPRSAGPFVAVNCAALPEALLESELFGHVKGAFTDARATRAGLFVQASGGTLFLDEIAEMPLGLQPKLLRALQERRVRPLGGDSEIAFDARLVVATNRDLENEVTEKRFREDLFYRVNVIHITLPPLRMRGSDILLLAQHFVTAAATASGRDVRGISPAAAQSLLSYPWPGNVRELQNYIQRAVALAQYADLSVEDLP
ncbi:MAG TPA: sigma-54 dependent transcriptional regulator, partial [Kofleriaceae bacterium]|nr:sigma-54 dependent transcriptional regulator [Kofleriaceae bacterium]